MEKDRKKNVKQIFIDIQVERKFATTAKQNHLLNLK